MQRLVTLAIVSAIALAACSSSETASNDTGPSTKVTIADASNTSTTSTPDSSGTPSTSAQTDTGDTTTTAPNPTSAVSQDDLVRFVAATEIVLKGTPNQGIVYDAPEIYIAIAQAACARFTAGETFEQVSNDLLAEVASSSSHDDNRLVGAILGAATQTICPEHANLI